MKVLVKKSPANPVSDAIKKVKDEAEEKYGDNEELWTKIEYELGNDKALLKTLLRVRAEVIGKAPRNRNAFNPENFLNRVLKGHNVVTMDSNRLNEHWRENIDKINPGSKFDWNKHEGVKEHEDDEETNEEADEDCQECNDGVNHLCQKDTENLEEDIEAEVAAETEGNDAVNDEPDLLNDEPEVTNKDLQKRVFSFSSKKLLKLFAKHLRTSVDGTFKSACFLWGHQFRWSVKIKGN